MAPWHASLGASLRDHAGQYGVAKKALVPVQLAGVDVWLAGIAGGIDEKFRPIALQCRAQSFTVGVVEFAAAKVAKWDPLLREQGLIGPADITGTSEQIDHQKE